MIRHTKWECLVLRGNQSVRFARILNRFWNRYKIQIKLSDKLGEKRSSLLWKIPLVSTISVITLSIYWRRRIFMTFRIINMFEKQIAMNSKDRVTAWLCTNAPREKYGYVIGMTNKKEKSRNLRGFRFQRLSKTYPNRKVEHMRG